MEKDNMDLYWRMLQGPAVLFLGQSYLRLESGVDPFLSEVLRKYGKPRHCGSAA